MCVSVWRLHVTHWHRQVDIFRVGFHFIWLKKEKKNVVVRGGVYVFVIFFFGLPQGRGFETIEQDQVGEFFFRAF